MPTEAPSSPLTNGTRVRMATPGKSGLMRGSVDGLDADHYHAVVNGRAVYFVHWDGGAFGGGWTDDDLVAL